MGCCSSKPGNQSCCCRVFCCCCSCCRKEEKLENSPNIQKSLPEPRTKVPTYDVTASYKIQRPKIKDPTEFTETTASILAFSQNMDRPSHLERNTAIESANDAPLSYVMLDDAQKLKNALRPVSLETTPNNFKTIEMPEEATKM